MKINTAQRIVMIAGAVGITLVLLFLPWTVYPNLEVSQADTNFGFIFQKRSYSEVLFVEAWAVEMIGILLISGMLFLALSPKRLKPNEAE